MEKIFGILSFILLFLPIYYPFLIHMVSTVPLLVHVIPHHQINYCYLSTRHLAHICLCWWCCHLEDHSRSIIYAFMKSSWPVPLGLKMSPLLDQGLEFQMHSWTCVAQLLFGYFNARRNKWGRLPNIVCDYHFMKSACSVLLKIFSPKNLVKI